MELAVRTTRIYVGARVAEEARSYRLARAYALQPSRIDASSDGFEPCLGQTRAPAPSCCDLPKGEERASPGFARGGSPR